MISEKKYAWYAAAAITSALLFRIFYIATTDYNLIADEAYFWDWSRHLDLSYYDQGPMIAFIIRSFTSFLPLSEFSVRLGAPVFSAMTSTVIYLLASEVLKSHKLAFFTILLMLFTPISTAGGVIITYYAPQVFYMSLAAFFLWRLIRDDKGWWWYPLGFSLGCGLLSHHMFSVFSAEVGLFVLLSRKHRKWLIKKELYIAIVIELLVASPVFIWNMTHEAVMAKHAVGLMTMSQDFFKTFAQFIGAQAGVQTPFFFMAVLYGLCISGYRGIIRKDDKHLFLFCLSAPLFAFIGVLCLGGRTEANWPSTAYITGAIAAASAVSEIYRNGSLAKQALIKGLYIFSILMGTSVLIVVLYPKSIYSLSGYALPPHMDPANRLYGWEELGNEVSKVLKKMHEETFVSSTGYGRSALLAFYVEGRPEVYEMPIKNRRMSQYDFWNGSMPVMGKDAVFVSVRESTINEVEPLFDSVELAKRLIIKAEESGLVRERFYIYRCYNYKGAETEQAPLKGF